MNNLIAGFASDVFRPIVSLLIPGFWLLTPWTIALFLHYEKIRDYANQHSTVMGIAFLVASTAAGLVLEDLGARLEEFSSHCHDHPKDNWYSYLRILEDEECIGTRYISAIALRMKFELDMVSAGPFSLVGILRLPVSWQLKFVLCGIVAVVTVFLAIEGHSSVALLEKTRIEILKRPKVSAESNT